MTTITDEDLDAMAERLVDGANGMGDQPRFFSQWVHVYSAASSSIYFSWHSEGSFGMSFEVQIDGKY
ncbi:unnamed protein product [Calypogeia fissa]